MKMPCEIIIWYILPAIRKGIADSMIKDYNLSQTEVAKKLGITRQAIAKRIKNSAKLQRARVTAVESNLDLAESELIKNIKLSNLKAVFYYLNNKGQARGYNWRNAHHDHDDDEPVDKITINVIDASKEKPDV